ncbi:pyruvate flavodoxin/ferredoxin oxidoreductase domain protein [Anaeromyxobacter dehalogenans 2CP-1]|uniref:Pyruvate flavodoxin/ferredoxin oxidoreductase domain protein n=1 Tax=Anaeromyxobacter dehalogenans (strain ATCC BAA-258 / DSM 21875 / 2CP-1) TaxID=455488 RepID=B8J902_ANAD2|nr:pyruvate:ferredoxin (flavodoxin) oxidoreductase [Anaeromyxobacter dehalogenans]ACL63600.1 pyruvate flavodoxin/ferredoxin oxidoreductase domain protein [Anaeromyxobacter dehalogenans 2CP-1]
MASRRMVTMDGNEAVASVAHRVSEVIAIYPITPSSNMGEWADEWSAKGRKNVWGTVPSVAEMQSEGGAAGAVHGALQAGSLTTTFTASQGLLLMIPNMYKIAGELTAFCMHVSARAVATHALSIFGDHSDVMAVRQTGFGLLSSASVQEAHDMAAIAHRATLLSRVPFLHFFDGFRTSHEVAKIEELTDDDLRAMIPEELVAAHRARALTPDRPTLRGSAQNPDAFFQAREACNPYYLDAAGHVQAAMDHFGKLTGRKYKLFEYFGHPEAERVVVAMGSACDTAQETVEHLIARGEKVGLLKVRLYRPFDLGAFMTALPRTVQALAVLDRTKEPGALGEPLYQDVVTALREAEQAHIDRFHHQITVIGGRYGLSSKEFTPGQVKAALDELLNARPKRHFTVGINDDVTHLSLRADPTFDTEGKDVVRALFFGLGADGTVGANKNSIKIIGEDTPNFAQGYFVYDSKKSGSVTISHLRFGPRPIHSAYLIEKANFVACHQFGFLEKYEMAEMTVPGATLLLNSPYGPDEVWGHLPREVQEQILTKGLKLYVIDAYKVARDTGMGVRINTIMQTCFFAISGVLPRDEAIGHIKKTIEKTYARKGAEVVQKNFAAVDHTLAHLYQVKVEGRAATGAPRPPTVSEAAPDFVKRVTALMLAGKGDQLPVSAFPVDGTWPTGTSKWEKRSIALEIPVWEPSLCIQCNKCALICPHAAIRPKFYGAEALGSAPKGFLAMDYKSADVKGAKYSLQVAPDDCTGCTLCVEICPAESKTEKGKKAINMAEAMPLKEKERANFEFFLSIPDADRKKVKLDVKGTQFLEPLFEFSGACTGCGETPYLKLLTQLYGDRAVIANATGCSSIFGGNLPTTPYTQNCEGRGPAWANSLFEDNAEFGFGMRLSIDKQAEQARELLAVLGPKLGDALVDELLKADQSDETGIEKQRARVAELKAKLQMMDGLEARWLLRIADYLVRKSVWIVGGDGWAYDIGYGGLDHVIAQGRDVNILVLDTEVYSNTGGQASKATPMGAAAKFAVAGKNLPKKDLAMLAMSYGHPYVARVAMGAKDAQTIAAFKEADSYPGTSVIVAYAHCIAHGYEMSEALGQQEKAVDSGYWPLFRYDPRRVAAGDSPLKLDSAAPKIDLARFTEGETRFRQVEQANPAGFARMLEQAQKDVREKYALYEQLAKAMNPANLVPGAAGGNGKPRA